MELVTHINNGVFTIAMSGRFTFTDNPEFKRVILNVIGDGSCKQMVLRMHQLEFVDSAGLGMLLLAHEEAEKHKKTLMLEGVTGQVRRIFDMARFDQFFTFI